MSSIRADRRSINRLFEIRNRFGKSTSKDKLDLLRLLDRVEARKCSDLECLHAALCFIRAFPDTAAHYRLARSQLDSFQDRIRKLPANLRSGLWDSGIVGSPVHYCFSYEVASWLARHAPNTVSIDWDAMENTSRLDEILEHLLLPSEEDYFYSG